MPRLAKLVIAVGAAIALAAVASGVTYAAASSKAVYGCSNSNGVLRLLTAKGKCPKHFSKVAISKQGPIGRTGATGKQGVPGPGAVSVRAETTSTTTTSFTDKVVPGVGLTFRTVCEAGSGNPSAVYLIDNQGTSPYSVRGSYLLTTGGGNGNLVNNGTLQANLAGGQGLVSYDQPGALNSASEFIATNGAQLGFDVLVTRGAQTVAVHGYAFQGANQCLALAEATPTS